MRGRISAKRTREVAFDLSRLRNDNVTRQSALHGQLLHPTIAVRMIFVDVARHWLGEASTLPNSMLAPPPKRSSPILIFLQAYESAQRCIISHKIPQKFSGDGAQPPPQTSPPLGRGTPAFQTLPPRHLRHLNTAMKARP